MTSTIIRLDDLLRSKLKRPGICPKTKLAFHIMHIQNATAVFGFLFQSHAISILPNFLFGGVVWTPCPLPDLLRCFFLSSHTLSTWWLDLWSFQRKNYSPVIIIQLKQIIRMLSQRTQADISFACNLSDLNLGIVKYWL